MNESHGGDAAARRCRGLTLLELMLAMAGTALVGLAITTMLVAVSSGTQSDKDMRRIVVQHKSLDARLSAALRESRQVLAADENVIVLWVYDHNENDNPDLSEIRRIELAEGVLSVYEAPHDLSSAADQAYTMNTNFLAVTEALKGQATFPGRPWGVGISDWTVSFNDADERAATLVSYRFTVQAGQLSDTAINAAALRNR